VIGTALVVAVVAFDRRRASQVLNFLVCATVFAAALSVGRELIRLHGSPSLEPNADATIAPIVAVLGVLFSCAMAVGAIDGSRRSSGRSERSSPAPTFTISCAIASAFVCIAAISSRPDPVSIAATLLGVGTLLAVVAIRKWFFELWGTTGVIVTMAFLFVASFSSIIPIRNDVDPIIALSPQNGASVERMLNDIPGTGVGAGAFQSLLPLYRDTEITRAGDRPIPAAAIAIDMGRAFLCLLIAAVLLGAFILLKRSLSRGRDYLYPAMGAGASLSLLMMIFSDSGSLDFGPSLLIGAVFGLAFGQSLSSVDRDTDALYRSRQSLNSDQNARSILPKVLNNVGRMALASLGVVLILQAAWMVKTELNGLEFFPMPSTLVSASAPDKTSKVVTVANAREERSRDSSLFGTKATIDQPASFDEQQAGASPAVNAFAKKLRYSPLRGDVWLALAAISKQRRWAGYDISALLRMSYYTAPNDLDLFPLRLHVALGTDAAVEDPELRELIKREISLVVARRTMLRPALASAFQSASTEGKNFTEAIIAELDPKYLDDIRRRHP
jgi:hypothetical protein